MLISSDLSKHSSPLLVDIFLFFSLIKLGIYIIPLKNLHINIYLCGHSSFKIKCDEVTKFITKQKLQNHELFLLL